MTHRLTPDERRKVILNAAIRIMLEQNTVFPKRLEICDACEVPTSMSTMRHYFPTVRDLRVAAARVNLDIDQMMRTRGLSDELRQDQAR